MGRKGAVSLAYYNLTITCTAQESFICRIIHSGQSEGDTNFALGLEENSR